MWSLARWPTGRFSPTLGRWAGGLVGAAEGRSRGRTSHVLATDPRVSALPAEYDFEVIGARHQRGIGPAFAALVRHVRDAEHILFLEEDFALAEGVAASELEATLEQARVALRDGVADV